MVDSCVRVQRRPLRCDAVSLLLPQCFSCLPPSLYPFSFAIPLRNESVMIEFLLVLRPAREMDEVVVMIELLRVLRLARGMDEEVMMIEVLRVSRLA